MVIVGLHYDPSPCARAARLCVVHAQHTEMRAATLTHHTFRSLTPFHPLHPWRPLHTPHAMLRRFCTAINSSTPPTSSINSSTPAIYPPTTPTNTMHSSTPTTNLPYPPPSTTTTTTAATGSTTTPPGSAKAHEEDFTHFGFRDVPKEQKESLVGEVFKKVAGNYDILTNQHDEKKLEVILNSFSLLFFI